MKKYTKDFDVSLDGCNLFMTDCGELILETKGKEFYLLKEVA